MVGIIRELTSKERQKTLIWFSEDSWEAYYTKMKYKLLKIQHLKMYQVKTKSWFFEKKNKIDKPLARLIRKKGRRLKSIELEMKKGKKQLTLQKYKGL